MSKPIWSGLNPDTVAYIEMHFSCRDWDLIGRALTQSKPHPSWTASEAVLHTEACQRAADAILTGLLAVGYYKITDS